MEVRVHVRQNGELILLRPSRSDRIRPDLIDSSFQPLIRLFFRHSLVFFFNCIPLCLISRGGSTPYYYDCCYGRYHRYPPRLSCWLSDKVGLVGSAGIAHERRIDISKDVKSVKYINQEPPTDSRHRIGRFSSILACASGRERERDWDPPRV